MIVPTRLKGRAPGYEVVSGWQSARPSAASRLKHLLIYLSIVVVLCLTGWLLKQGQLPFSPLSEEGFAPTKEAYVLFLPTASRPEYVLAARVVLFGLKHDPLVRDPTRDVVIITTPQVQLEIEEQLRAEGAIVERHDLVTGIPTPYDPEGDDRWKDQYSKLLIFNMTKYERILYLDSDMVLNNPLAGIWDDPHAWPASGLAARAGAEIGHAVPPPQGNKLNSGLLLVVPSTALFKALLLVRDFDGMDIEQSLLNKYFARDGEHPWELLGDKYVDLSRTGVSDRFSWVANRPYQADINYGVAVLHEKGWAHNDGFNDIPRAVSELWRERLGRMEGYYLAEADLRV